MAVVEKSVEDCGGNHLVAEDMSPLGDGLVGRDQHASSLVAAAHQLKELVRKNRFVVGPLVHGPAARVRPASSATRPNSEFAEGLGRITRPDRTSRPQKGQ